MNIFWITLLNLCCYVLANQCRTSDYLSVFGSGVSTEMTIESFVHDWVPNVGYLAVAGTGTITGVKSSFFYVVDYLNNCAQLSTAQTLVLSSYNSASPGITSVHLKAETGDTVYMIAYLHTGTQFYEVLIVAEALNLAEA